MEPGSERRNRVRILFRESTPDVEDDKSAPQHLQTYDALPSIASFRAQLSFSFILECGI